MDEGVGNAVNNNALFNENGTMIGGGAGWTTNVAPAANGLSPYAVTLNGSSDYIETEIFDINNDFTISLWVNPHSLTSNDLFVAKNRNVLLPYR